MPIIPRHPLRFDTDILSIYFDLLGNPAIILYFRVVLLSTSSYFTGKLAVPQLISKHLVPSTNVTTN